MKKLEELLNIAPAADEDDSNNEAPPLTDEAMDRIAELDCAIDKIDCALPMVADLDTADKELDELAELAKDTFTELNTLAMNVEPRFSGPIIQSAATLLGHAITAKQAKIDKKLKMVDLQLKKLALNQKQQALDMKANSDPVAAAQEGTGIVLDRNELLKQILNKGAS